MNNKVLCMKKFLIHTCIVIIIGFSMGYTGANLIKFIMHRYDTKVIR